MRNDTKIYKINIIINITIFFQDKKAHQNEKKLRPHLQIKNVIN